MATVDDFEITVRPQQDGYLAGVPRLGLYARGRTAADAFAALATKKAALEADITAAGVTQPFPEGGIAGPPAGFLDALGLFTAKALVVFLLLTFTLAASGTFVINRIHHVMADILGSETLGGSKFWSGVEQNLHRAAAPDQDLPEPKKQQLISDVRVIVTRWRPMVAEITALFARDVPPGPPTSTPQH